MKNSFKSRTMAWLLTLCMVISLVPGLAIGASAGMVEELTALLGNDTISSVKLYLASETNTPFQIAQSGVITIASSGYTIDTDAVSISSDSKSIVIPDSFNGVYVLSVNTTSGKLYVRAYNGTGPLGTNLIPKADGSITGKGGGQYSSSGDTGSWVLAANADTVSSFLTNYLTFNAATITEANTNTYRIIMGGENTWNALGNSEKLAINDALSIAKYGTDYSTALLYTDLLNTAKTIADTPVEVENFSEFQTAVANGGSIKLKNDIEISANVAINNDVTIDGQGSYKLYRASSFKNTLFTVNTGKFLTLKNVTVDGGAIWKLPDGSTDWTELDDTVYTRINKGVFATASEGGVGQLIYVAGGTLNLIGSTLQNNDRRASGNTASTAPTTDEGSAVYVNTGNFSMDASSSIKNNRVSDEDKTGNNGDGAALSVQLATSVNVSGKIFGNFSPRMGGAIRIFGSSGANVTFSDVEIYANYTVTDNGAVCIGGSTDKDITVSGKVVINNNKKYLGTADSINANVRLLNSSSLKNGTLTDGSYIGVYSAVENAVVVTDATSALEAYLFDDAGMLQAEFDTDNETIVLKDGAVNSFLAKLKDSDGNAKYTSVNDDNYAEILALETDWNALTDAQRAKVDTAIDPDFSKILAAAKLWSAAKDQLDAVADTQLTDADKQALSDAIIDTRDAAIAAVNAGTENALENGLDAINLFVEKTEAILAVRADQKAKKDNIDLMSPLNTDGKNAKKAELDNEADDGVEAIIAANSTTCDNAKTATLAAMADTYSEALVNNKTAAHDALDAYATAILAEIEDLENLESSELNELNNAVIAARDAAKQVITNEYTNELDLDSFVKAGYAAMDLVKAKAEAIDKINEAARDAIEEINAMPNLTQEHKNALIKAVQDEAKNAKANIMEADSIAAVETALEDGIDAIDFVLYKAAAIDDLDEANAKVKADMNKLFYISPKQKSERADEMDALVQSAVDKIMNVTPDCDNNLGEDGGLETIDAAEARVDEYKKLGVNSLYDLLDSISKYGWDMFYIPYDNYYAVAFETAGGTPIKEVIRPIGATITLARYTTELADHKFEGWFLDPECTLPAPTSFRITENTALYAKWTSLLPVVEEAVEAEAIAVAAE